MFENEKNKADQLKVRFAFTEIYLTDYMTSRFLGRNLLQFLFILRGFVVYSEKVTTQAFNQFPQQRKSATYGFE